MITVQDKIPFFRKIMENEFKLQLSESYKQLEDGFAERKHKLDKRLDNEMKDRTERQQLLLDTERRTKLGQAESNLKQSLLLKRQELLGELRSDITHKLREWLTSDDFLQSISHVKFNRVEGPAAMQSAVEARFPGITYEVRPMEGVTLYDDKDGSRIDLSLGRYLERYEKVLSQTFTEMVGV